jgi:hypothetical protein
MGGWTALDAIRTRIDADLVPLVADTTSQQQRGARIDAVRTLEFASDHRCQVLVVSAGPGLLAAEFTTELRSSFDVELWNLEGAVARGRWAAGRALVFDAVSPGPMRLVYGRFHRSRPGRRYETEWVSLP